MSYEGIEPVEEQKVPAGKPESIEDFWAGFEPKKATLEKQLYGKHHNAWAALKTVESFLPFGKLLGLTESGRKEYEYMDSTDRALFLGLSAAEIIPLAFVGKALKVSAGTGFKTLRKAARIGGKTVKARDVKHSPRTIEMLRSELSTRLKPFVEETEDTLLQRRWRLSGNEARAVKEGWTKEFLDIHPGSEQLRKLVDKGGNLKPNAKKQLQKARRPFSEKYREHYMREWQRVTRQVMGKQFASKENQDRVFKQITKELYGESHGMAAVLENAGPDEFADIALRMLDDPGKFKKMASLGRGSIFPTKLMPTRMIFGGIDDLFGTMENVYKKGSRAYSAANEYGFNKIRDFSAALADKGLGKFRPLAGGDFRFKLFKENRDAYYTAGQALREIDELTSKKAPEDALRAVYMAQDETTQKFMDTWWEWADDMYFDQLRHQVQRAINVPNVPAVAKMELAQLLEKGDQSVLGQLDRIFKGSWDVATYAKAESVKAEIARLTNAVEELSTAGRIDKKTRDYLSQVLSPKSKENPEGLVDYLANYVARVSDARGSTRKGIADRLTTGRLRAFYTKSRTRTESDAASTNLGRLVQARAQSQGKELYFYPVADEISQWAKRLPHQHREYTAHWLFRLLGQPSHIDVKVADWIGSTYGRLEKIFGGTGVWDERRVMNLAHNINNLIYLGGLGFKPFSALRNLVQYPITVPGDLGGAKNFGWLFKGIQKSSDPRFRDYVRNELKAIQEYAPELHLRAKAVPGIRLGVKGRTIDLPDTQTFRDTGMFLFQMSDRWNRYATAGAAAAKWEHHAARMIKNGEVSERFLKKMNIGGRNPWIKSELEELLREGGEANIRQAKNLFINDVIGDTQFLYGIVDAPIATHAWGTPAKTAMVFQSWWLNYGRLLEKWIRTGDAGTKANRMFTFMLSAAIAEQVMEPIWGRSTAARTVGLGPFPSSFNEFMIPPVYKPMYHALAGAIDVGKLDFDSAERHAKQIMRSGLMFVPGGLQGAQTFRAVSEEGFSGLAPSIIRYHRDKDYEPIFGLFD